MSANNEGTPRTPRPKKEELRIEMFYSHGDWTEPSPEEAAANIPTSEAEAAKAAARECCEFADRWYKGPGKDLPNGSFGENMAAIIARHFAPLRAELERVKGENDRIKNINKTGLAMMIANERDQLRSELTAARARIGELEKELKFALLRADQEETAAGNYARTIFDLRQQLALANAKAEEARTELEGKTALLVKCHRHLCTEIQALTLNESAKSGSQSLLREISVVLDAARSALSGKGEA